MTNHEPLGEREDAVIHIVRDARWRIFLALAGVATLAAGAVAVFATSNGTGSGALVAAGVLCLVLAVLWDRVKTVRGAGVEVEMLQVAQHKLAAADVADLRGDSAEATRLRAEAEQLLSLARPWAADYERWRVALPSGPERTALMEQAVTQAIETARTSRRSGQPIHPDAVKALFDSGGDGARVTALGFHARGSKHGRSRHRARGCCAFSISI